MSDFNSSFVMVVVASTEHSPENSKPAYQARGLPCFRLYPLNTRERRSCVKCAHETTDRLLIAFRDNLYPSIVKVAYEATESLPMSYVYYETPEANSLYAALNEEPLGNNH